jgi:uncharacterized damage-inducible protein DinB
MITPEYSRTMAAYNTEMNRRTYLAALRLTDEERRADRGVFWGSIHGTLSHILWADGMWLSRFGASEKPEAVLADSDRFVDHYDDLWTQRQQLDRIMLEWAGRLTSADLAADLTWFSAAAGHEITKHRSLVIMHIFNHQTHHRGQVHALITRAGERTGDTDLPLVLPD